MQSIQFHENDVIQSLTGTNRTYRVTKVHPWGIIYAVALKGQTTWPIRIDEDAFRHFKVIGRAA